MISDQYPEGKKYPDDLGALSIHITVDRKRRVVRLDFGKPIEWVAFEPLIAQQFAKLIIKKAKEL